MGCWCFPNMYVQRRMYMLGDGNGYGNISEYGKIIKI